MAFNQHHDDSRRGVDPAVPGLTIQSRLAAAVNAWSHVRRKTGVHPGANARQAVCGKCSRPLFNILAALLSAAALSACVQTPFVGQNLASRVERIETPSEADQVRPQVASKPAPARRRVAKADRPKTLASRPKASTRDASVGLASFYRHGNKTASGEKFDSTQLTAAHPSLPFGTRLRVTNVTTGQSVTVRVNDRGPFVAGRIVDVSHSAAEALGMTGAGVAKVKLDVVE
jgi:rare lipoprotein A